MKISCCWMYAIGKYGFPPAIDQMFLAIQEMADLGFQHIEMEGEGYKNLQALVDNRDRLKAAIDKAGVRVSNFAVILPEMISADPGEAARAMKAFELGVQTAAFFGTPRMWIDSYFPPVEVLSGALMTEEIVFGQQYRVRIPDGFSWESFWERFVGVMRKASALAKRQGIELLIEPRVGEVTPSADGLLRLLEAVDDPNLGVILDTAHQHAQKELLPLSIMKLGKRIRYVHVADNDGRDNRHLPPGAGNIDWDEVFRSLKQIGYDGFFATDIEKVPDLEKAFGATKEFLEAQGRKWGL